MSSRYSYTKLRQIVLRMKDVEEIPTGFTRKHLISEPATIYKGYRFLFDGYPHERFLSILLDAANYVSGMSIVSEGILNSSLVHPREVFAPAMHSLSAAIILCHNHPSGNPEPSSEDIAITRQIVEAGKILGIPVRDHIIFTPDTYTSFMERGLL